VVVDKVGTSQHGLNAACCTGLPHAADVVMGTPSSPPCCPEDFPADVSTRPVTEADMPAVLAIYGGGPGHPQRHLRGRAAHCLAAAH
jgi:hypothetical protein